ncbi:MAG: hypothetical protein ABWW69_07195 [Pyrodictiaceae archaeon]
MLEESYIMARYGAITYGEKQARLCVRTAEEALEVLARVEERVASIRAREDKNPSGKLEGGRGEDCASVS